MRDSRMSSTDLPKEDEPMNNGNDELEELSNLSASDVLHVEQETIVSEIIFDDEIQETGNDIKGSQDKHDMPSHTGNDNQNVPHVHENVSDYEHSDSSTSIPTSSYKFDHVPVQFTGAWKQFDSLDNFTKGCKWAPDGSCILTCSNDNVLRIFNFPSELWQADFNWEDVGEMSPVLEIREGGGIYDYAWYPEMSSSDPVTCCLCSTSNDSPVHLWDAFTGQLRCTYRPYNHVDEITTPYSVAFDSLGQQIFCGFQKMIRIFDVSIPGRECTERPTYSKKSGQSGIISCFAFSSALSNVSAAGSYNKTIGLYSEPSGFLEHILEGHAGGLTHLMFSEDGMKLYSGARKDFEILCWDMRNLSSVLFSARRLCTTNQRLYFDISKCGRYLISGNHNGVVTVWDLTDAPIDLPNSNHPVLQPLHFYQAHDDCVNGVSFNSAVPFIATCSGQRKFLDPVDSEDDDEASDQKSERTMFSKKNVTKDNSLRLWIAS